MTRTAVISSILALLVVPRPSAQARKPREHDFVRWAQSLHQHPIGVLDMDTKMPHSVIIASYGKPGVRRPGYPFDWNQTAAAGAFGWYGSVNDLSQLLLQLRTKVLSRAAWNEMWRDLRGYDRQQPSLAKEGTFTWDSPEGAGEAHSAVTLYPDDVQAVCW